MALQHSLEIRNALIGLMIAIPAMSALLLKASSRELLNQKRKTYLLLLSIALSVLVYPIYAYYESGISPDYNIRFDAVLFLPPLIINTILLIVAAIRFAPAQKEYVKEERIHRGPVPDKGITIEDDKILHNGKLFAELRYYFTATVSEEPGEACSVSYGSKHRGLAIYFENERELVWIFPEDGREEDVATGRFRARGQTDEYVGWLYDVHISYDGRFVYYKKPGLISPSSYVFSVERRASKLVNGDWHSLYA